MCGIYEHFLLGPLVYETKVYSHWIYGMLKISLKEVFREVFENYLAFGGLLGWHVISNLDMSRLIFKKKSRKVVFSSFPSFYLDFCFHLMVYHVASPPTVCLGYQSGQ